MGFVASPNCGEFGLQITVNGQKCANVFHVEGAAPYNAGTLTVVSAFLTTWWFDNIRPQLSNDVALTSIIARSLESINAPSIEFDDTMPIVGSASTNGPILPHNVTVAIKWTTGLRGRSYRGRTYHPALYEGQVVGSIVDAGELTQLVDGYSALIPALAAEGYTLVVYSRYANKLERATGVCTPITNCSADDVVDSQRRRLPGRGQ